MDTAERLLLFAGAALLLTVVVGVDERVLLLTALLRDTAVDGVVALRVMVEVEVELVPVAPTLLRAVVRVVAELPLNVLSLRPVVTLFVPTEERVERFVLFVTALLDELRLVVVAASPLNDVLRPVVAVVLRLEAAEVLREEEATAELRLLTADGEAYPVLRLLRL